MAGKKKQLGLLPLAMDMGRVLYFASGTNRPGEILGTLEAGLHVGISVKDVLRKEGIPAEVRAALLHAPSKAEAGMAQVFVDSGAFSEMGVGPQGLYVKTPISLEEWQRRFEVYLVLAHDLGARLHAVAPDQVGNQAVTLFRQETFYPTFKEISDLGATILVPVQKGSILMPDFWVEEQKILRHLPRLIPAIPMAKDATPIEEIEHFVAVVKPARIHLLGKGPKSKKRGPMPAFDEICYRLWAIHPDLFISCDSVVLASSAMVGSEGMAPYSWEKERQVQQELVLSQMGIDYADENFWDFNSLTDVEWREFGLLLGLSINQKFILANDRGAYLESVGVDWREDPYQQVQSVLEGFAYRRFKQEQIVEWKTARALVNVFLGEYGDNIRDRQIMAVRKSEEARLAQEDPERHAVRQKDRAWDELFRRFAREHPEDLAAMDDPKATSYRRKEAKRRFDAFMGIPAEKGGRAEPRSASTDPWWWK